MNYTCTVILKKSSIEMFQVYILLQLAFVSVLGDSVSFQDCGSAYELTAVNIEGCDDHIPCYVTIGDQVLVKLEFFADFVSQNLDQNVLFNINYLYLRTEVTPETCGIYDCPVMTADTKNSLTSVMAVPRLAVNLRGFLVWAIRNEDGKQVLCYKVQVQTQSQLQKLMRNYVKRKTAQLTRLDQP